MMITSEDVANYLKNNPGFFAQHQEVLVDLELDTAQQPFHQRQLDVLRQRHADEKAKYQLVVDSARNNQALDKSLHEYAQKLLGYRQDPDSLAAERITEAHFSIGYARICQESGDNGDPHDNNQHSNISEEDLSAIVQRVRHGNSVCDDRVSSSLLACLFGVDHDAGSCAFVPCKAIDTDFSGVMVLGDADPTRFAPGIGTIYLDRMGQLVAAFLSR